ncbi:transcription factor kapC [Fusarium heterosporum]|uniref:Putative transcription factor kapC n=1 Tax=Fusarium heterosporum TaxID=42747 RepID=A0A8H5T910_FUSHE|nr:transcription factor kapC [Fusarium heterosporum]
MQNSSANGANNQEQHLRAQLELLKSHDATGSSSPTPPGTRDHRPQPLQPAPVRPSNGFDHLSNPQDQNRPLAAKSEVEAHIHPDLRARAAHAPTANMMPIAPPSGHSPGASAGPSSAPIAPAPPPSMSLDDHDHDHLGDGRKAKRELSQSKRAAQNRAAQRAFRQRKEGYIKKLEQQVREYMEMEHSFKSVQSENYALREYIVHLQSRLFDVSGEYPPPPPNVNLSQPAQQAPAPATTAPPPPPEPAPSNPAAGTPLEAVAQAVAGLAAQEQIERQQYPTAHFKTEVNAEDTRTADEINKQLQHSEGSPAQQPAV